MDALHSPPVFLLNERMHIAAISAWVYRSIKTVIQTHIRLPGYWVVNAIQTHTITHFRHL